MPVNNFEFEKADGIISSIKGQSVGRDPISAAGIFDFVSIAQKGFGYEPEEEDMIKVVHLTFESPLLQTDLKEEEITGLIESGTVIYFFDSDDYMDMGFAGIYYLVGKGPNEGQWVFASITNENNVVTALFDTGVDGCLYIIFD